MFSLTVMPLSPKYEKNAIFDSVNVAAVLLVES